MAISGIRTGETGISLALDNNYMEPIATTLVGSGTVQVALGYFFNVCYWNSRIVSKDDSTGFGTTWVYDLVDT